MHATSSVKRFAWRTVDIVITAVLGVVSGVLFWAWDQAYTPLSVALAATPGLVGLLNGGWLFAGVIAGIVVRKPGAAVIASVVAGFVESLIGSNWGFSNLPVALIQGLGAELAILIFGYASSRLIVALIAGALSGVAATAITVPIWYPGSTVGFILIYGLTTVISGIVLAGILPWAVARGLVAAGALRRFPIAAKPNSATR